MDYNTFMQFFRELGDDARNHIPFVPDYSSNIESIKSSMASLVLSLDSIAKSLDTVVKPLLESEALAALRRENTKLTAVITSKEMQMAQMRALIQDLSEPCIGCKKEPWQPHKDGCMWYHANEKLLEALNVKDSGETESAS